MQINVAKINFLFVLFEAFIDGTCIDMYHNTKPVGK